MPNNKIIPLEELGRLIPDGAVVSISSSSGLGCPDAALRAIGEHFEAEGRPQGLTTIHPIAAGDMYGIDGIDHLAQPGLLKRIIAGSLPSGPSSMPAPKIWQMICDNQIEAYNLPSGIVNKMHREASAGSPGVLTKVGLDTFVDPRRSGGRMNAFTTEDIVRLVEFDGQEWLHYPVIPVDVAIVRGTTSDELGNISMEHEGSYLGALDQAMAARNHGGIVIAQVKRITAAGSIPPQQVRVPSIHVDYVVVAPDQLQTTQTIYDPAISGELRRPLSVFDPVEWAPEKVIARRVALELSHGETVNLGFGISALVPYVMLEEGLADAVTWVIEQGAVGGMPLTGFQFGCAVNPQALVSSPDQFSFFQGGGLSRGLLSFLEVDRHGNVNVSRLSAKPHVTSGIGGFMDITSRTPNLVFSGYFTAGKLKLDLREDGIAIAHEGRAHKFVHEVEQITFSGRRALEQGQRVTYVTERCVISLEKEGLTVLEIAPGIDLERDVLAQADFPLKVSSDLRQMDKRLYRREPLGLELT
jgi:acyl CoA:acetate/3-ketoacid CoA transferase